MTRAANGPTDPPILIAGAGLSGLAVARALDRRGAQYAVLEAAARPGGVIRSGRVEGRLLEWGPQRARLTPALHTLTRELGIERDLIRAPAGLPLLIYRDGALRTVPLSLSGLLRGDLFSTAATLRLLLEPFTPAQRGDESVAGFFRRRFGEEAYQHLLGPLFGGLYASDPADMLVRHSLAPLLRQLGVGRSLLVQALRRGTRAVSAVPACSFSEGLQTLTDAMYTAGAPRIQLAERVTAVLPARDGYVVETTARTRRCRVLVLTVDARSAASLLDSVDAAGAARLRALHYNEFAIVHLSSGAALHGMGYQVSFAEPLATRGVTFNRSLFAREDVHTAFLGGAKDRAFMRRSDDDIGDVACAEFRLVTGHDARVLDVTRVTIPAWDRSWTALDGYVPPAKVLLCANYESRVGIPGRFARAEAVAAQAVEAAGGA